MKFSLQIDNQLQFPADKKCKGDVFNIFGSSGSLLYLCGGKRANQPSVKISPKIKGKETPLLTKEYTVDDGHVSLMVEKSSIEETIRFTLSWQFLDRIQSRVYKKR